ncbi:MAG TPA: HD domain-containing protein [Symbiobacteriaceae bacterium]|jgi:metal-dependent HD superfamily phosphatase/phosphodiesterase|nr:HD domain-containing protein [Symbiobacteriaceae bacterium]
MAEVTFEMVKADPEVQTYIRYAQEMLAAIAFTEHGLRHVGLVAHRAMKVMEDLGRPARMVELAGIAALLHDIGNIVNRHDHGQSGALLAHQILSRMGMPPDEIAVVMSAIGNHEEEVGNPVNDVAAALILADKSDVHRSRVSNRDKATFDIHDRVNYAAEHSELVVLPDAKVVRLQLKVDTSIIQIMEYFEIFLNRMIMSRRAATFFGCHYELVINDTRLL